MSPESGREDLNLRPLAAKKTRISGLFRRPVYCFHGRFEPLPMLSESWATPRRAVGLALVARHASQHVVFPGRGATLRPRHDVVVRQFVAARLATAILAGPMVPLENIAAAEAHGRARQSIVARKRDHFRHPQPLTTRADSFHSSTSAERCSMNRCAVDRPGVEPGLPGCRPGVVPFDQQPVFAFAKVRPGVERARRTVGILRLRAA